jgi:hypothetical protein
VLLVGQIKCVESDLNRGFWKRTASDASLRQLHVFAITRLGC